MIVKPFFDHKPLSTSSAAPLSRARFRAHACVRRTVPAVICSPTPTLGPLVGYHLRTPRGRAREVAKSFWLPQAESRPQALVGHHFRHRTLVGHHLRRSKKGAREDPEREHPAHNPGPLGGHPLRAKRGALGAPAALEGHPLWRPFTSELRRQRPPCQGPSRVSRARMAHAMTRRCTART